MQVQGDSLFAATTHATVEEHVDTLLVLVATAHVAVDAHHDITSYSNYPCHSEKPW